MPVKKIISYNNLDGNPVSDEYWFALGKTDAIEMDIAHMENPAEYLQKLIDDNDSRKMLDLWKEMLFRSVGVRVEDGIDKGEHVVARFRRSGAYEQFFSDLIEMSDAGASFFLSIMPGDVQAKVAENESPDRGYTDDEKLAMSDDEFKRVVGEADNMSKHDLMLAYRRKMTSV